MTQNIQIRFFNDSSNGYEEVSRRMIWFCGCDFGIPLASWALRKAKAVPSEEASDREAQV